MLRQILGQAKKHPSLIPLFVFIGAGGTGAALYVMRLALFNPDVSWDRKNNPEPWNKLGPNEQYKFYSVNVDYSKLNFNVNCFMRTTLNGASMIRPSQTPTDKKNKTTSPKLKLPVRSPNLKPNRAWSAQVVEQSSRHSQPGPRLLHL